MGEYVWVKPVTDPKDISTFHVRVFKDYYWAVNDKDEICVHVAKDGFEAAMSNQQFSIVERHMTSLEGCVGVIKIPIVFLRDRPSWY